MRVLALGASIALGLGLLAVILYYVGWQGIVREIASLGWIGFLALAGDFSLTFFFWALTWRIILRAYGIGAPWKAVFRALLSGYTVSYLTPSFYFGGEPVRVYIFAKELDLPQPRLYATVLVSKLLEALGLILFILLGVFYALFAEGNLSQIQRRSLFYGAIFFSFWVLLGLINFSFDLSMGTWLLRGLRRLLPWKEALGKAAEKVGEVEREIYQAFHQGSKLPATAVAFLTSLLANFLIYLRPQIFFYFSQGRSLSFANLSLVYSLWVLLAALFWITPGGIGISEGGWIGIFTLVGIAETGAVAFSLILKGFELTFVALGVSLLMEFGLLHRLRSKSRSRSRHT
ncbi:TPA: flippase-like domain-containing protein [Candidatus Bipolaricaulota bacterium]|nr:flippase-like domain-containing protein [Candidatus Bipolaricaulota bacterium]